MYHSEVIQRCWYSLHMGASHESTSKISGLEKARTPIQITYTALHSIIDDRRIHNMAPFSSTGQQLQGLPASTAAS